VKIGDDMIFIISLIMIFLTKGMKIDRNEDRNKGMTIEIKE